MAKKDKQGRKKERDEQVDAQHCIDRDTAVLKRELELFKLRMKERDREWEEMEKKKQREHEMRMLQYDLEIERLRTFGQGKEKSSKLNTFQKGSFSVKIETEGNKITNVISKQRKQEKEIKSVWESLFIKHDLQMQKLKAFQHSENKGHLNLNRLQSVQVSVVKQGDTQSSQQVKTESSIEVINRSGVDNIGIGTQLEQKKCLNFNEVDNADFAVKRKKLRAFQQIENKGHLDLNRLQSVQVSEVKRVTAQSSQKVKAESSTEVINKSRVDKIDISKQGEREKCLNLNEDNKAKFPVKEKMVIAIQEDGAKSCGVVQDIHSSNVIQKERKVTVRPEYGNSQCRKVVKTECDIAGSNVGTVTPIEERKLIVQKGDQNTKWNVTENVVTTLSNGGSKICVIGQDIDFTDQKQNGNVLVQDSDSGEGEKELISHVAKELEAVNKITTFTCDKDELVPDSISGKRTSLDNLNSRRSDKWWFLQKGFRLQKILGRDKRKRKLDLKKMKFCNTGKTNGYRSDDHRDYESKFDNLNVRECKFEAYLNLVYMDVSKRCWKFRKKIMPEQN